MTLTKTTDDIDLDLIIDGARAAIISNVAALAYLKLSGDDPSLARIFPDAAPEEDLSNANGIARAKLAYIALSIPSAVSVGTYSHAMFNCLLQFSIYKVGWADANIRALTVQVVKSLVVTPWTLSGGLKLLSASMKGPGTGFRPASNISNGVMTRGKAGTARVIIQR